MATIRFDRHPATITVGDGLSMAATYWAACWELWIIPVVAVAIVNGMVTAVLGATMFDSNALGRTVFNPADGDQEAARRVFASLPLLTVASLVAAGVSLVAGWYLTAIAVAGLRGRPLEAGWVLGAGLRALAAELIIAVAMILAIILFAVLTAITGGLLLITLVVVIPAACYLAIRLIFLTLAIFDGAGIGEAFEVAWNLSRSAVLRMLGWGLLVAVIGFGLSLAMGAVSLATAGVPAIATALSQGVTMAFTMFSTIALAVLYESQRWLTMPPPMPSPAAAAPAAPYDPYAPPPPPPPHASADRWGAPPPAWPGSGPRWPD